MSQFEQMFSWSTLEVVVPDTSLTFPPTEPTDEWLAHLRLPSTQRNKAFFDEQLHSLLVLRIEHPSSGTTPSSHPDQQSPPETLLSFLAHIQVSLEATYISPHSAASVAEDDPPPSSYHTRPGNPRNGSQNSNPNPNSPSGVGSRTSATRPSSLSLTVAAIPHLNLHAHMPPPAGSGGGGNRPTSLRVGALNQSQGRLNHPSIFPPNTPNPTPAVADQDRKYAGVVEGTVLVTGIWGQETVSGGGGNGSGEPGGGKSAPGSGGKGGGAGGIGGGKDGGDAFALLWSDRERVWVAIYRLGLTVSFLKLNFTDPLLCLTVSATLRDKSIVPSTMEHPLAQYFASIGASRSLLTTTPAADGENGTTTQAEDGEAKDKKADEDEDDDEMYGLEEVNLLEGLFAGPTFAPKGPTHVSLPTTRLGATSRRQLFSLAPANHAMPIKTSTTPPSSSASSTSSSSASSTSTVTNATSLSSRIAHPTLRKSFRKVLQTVSGFRVRMRTVFVPFVLLPEKKRARVDGEGDNENGNDNDNDGGGNGGLDEKEEEEERERREAGTEERTVVLCVEVENSGEAGGQVGFAVEKVDMTIGGQGAKATLIGWGEGGAYASAGWFDGDKKQEGGSGGVEDKTFPLYVGSAAQFNLLYAVSFLRAPDEVDGFSLVREMEKRRRFSGFGGVGVGVNPDLQRAVAINIFGRPYMIQSSEMTKDDYDPESDNDEDRDGKIDPDALFYPTKTFSSRWNCVLDLSTQHHHQQQQQQQQQQHLDSHAFDGGGSDVWGDHPSNRNPSVLPEPASPFPTLATPTTAGFPSPRGNVPPPLPLLPSINTAAGASAVQPLMSAGLGPGGGGRKRYTMPEIINSGMVAQRSINRTSHQQFQPNYRLSAPPGKLNTPPLPSATTGRISYLPPSLNALTGSNNNSGSGNGSGNGGTTTPPNLSYQRDSMTPTTTTFAPPPPPTPPMIDTGDLRRRLGMGGEGDGGGGFPPMTPAYPAYPQSHQQPFHQQQQQQQPYPLPPSTPFTQGPLSAYQTANVGPSVEIKRERGIGGVASTPLTAGPLIGGMPFGSHRGGGMDESGGGGSVYDGVHDNHPHWNSQNWRGGGGGGGGGEGIVVSVGLLPPIKKGGGDGKVYPLECFTLDVFVFNQSSWTRRFEVSCPDRRRRRRDAYANNSNTIIAGGGGGGKGGVGLGFGVGDVGGGGSSIGLGYAGTTGSGSGGMSGSVGERRLGEVARKMGYPGILPLDFRVRVGPLLPSACQSVRMRFLAITPGVHPIEMLTLTDIETGFAMNLRSVADIVVHDFKLPKSPASLARHRDVNRGLSSSSSSHEEESDGSDADGSS